VHVHRRAVLPEDPLPLLLHVVGRLAVPRERGVFRLGRLMTAPSRLPYTHAATQRRLRERRGRLRVLVDGRLVAPVPDGQHGSVSTYNNWMCRCAACSDAARENGREQRERAKRAAAARLARIRAAAGRRTGEDLGSWSPVAATGSTASVIAEALLDARDNYQARGSHGG
jgi:hypothetical protein